jgi:hypothetical protein
MVPQLVLMKWILLFYPLNLQQLFLERRVEFAITVSPLAAFSWLLYINYNQDALDTKYFHIQYVQRLFEHYH